MDYYLSLPREHRNNLVMGLLVISALALGTFAVLQHYGPALFSSKSSTSSVQYADQSLTTSPKQLGLAAVGVLVPGCSLRLAFQPSQLTVNSGDTITYTATISNQGTDTCRNVSMSVYYASNETYLSGSPVPNRSNYYWAYHKLPSGASKTITIKTKATPAPGDTGIDNQACVTADNSSDVCVQNAIFLGTAPVTATQPTAPQTTSSGTWGAAFSNKELGMWVWDTPLQMSATYEKDALATLSANGFNTVYISADDYVPIAALADGPTKTAQQSAYFSALANFVHQANAYGIAVFVEGGAPDWTEPANWWKGYALVDLVQAYNQANPTAQVRGLQYDVESYLLPDYDTNQAAILTDYLQFIDNTTSKMQLENPNAHFEVVIPHFYDSVVAWTPLITYNGTSAYTYTHLLQILQRYPGSTMVDMAYRNFFSGANGTQDLVNAEITQAAAGYTTRVIVAQETGNVPPSYVTFYGLPKSALYTQLSQIYSTYSGYSSFGGMAIDYFDPFIVLQ